MQSLDGEEVGVSSGYSDRGGQSLESVRSHSFLTNALLRHSTKAKIRLHIRQSTTVALQVTRQHLTRSATWSKTFSYSGQVAPAHHTPLFSMHSAPIYCLVTATMGRLFAFWWNVQSHPHPFPQNSRCFSMGVGIKI